MRRRPTLSSRAFVSLALMLGVALFGTNPASAQQITLISSASDGTAGNGGDSYEPVDQRGWPLRRVLVHRHEPGARRYQRRGRRVREGSRVRRDRARQRDDVGRAGDRAQWQSADLGRRPVRRVRYAGAARARRHERARRLPRSGRRAWTSTSTIGRRAPRPGSVFPATGAHGEQHSYALDISADGRFVLFSRRPSNLVDNDTNNAQRPVPSRSAERDDDARQRRSGGQISSRPHLGNRPDERGRPLSSSTARHWRPRTETGALSVRAGNGRGVGPVVRVPRHEPAAASRPPSIRTAPTAHQRRRARRRGV